MQAERRAWRVTQSHFSRLPATPMARAPLSIAIWPAMAPAALAAADTSTVSPGRSRARSSSLEIRRHARHSEHSQSARGGCLPRVKQSGALAVRNTQVLQAEVEHYEAADAEHLVARFDDLADAVRGNQIARFRSIVRIGVRGAH